MRRAPWIFSDDTANAAKSIQRLGTLLEPEEVQAFAFAHSGPMVPCRCEEAGRGGVMERFDGLTRSARSANPEPVSPSGVEDLTGTDRNSWTLRPSLLGLNGVGVSIEPVSATGADVE